ncbi:MAG TPA: CDC27 family protein [Gemmatales bacterium]|nr:CDC27 family protein [Gemmatales bacterium]
MTRAAPSQPWYRWWQVPIFVIGLGAFLAVLLWPKPKLPGPTELLAQRLKQAWSLEEAGTPDQLLETLQALEPLDAATPEQHAELRFLHGLAFARRAELAEAGTDTAAAAWRRARSELEHAGQLPLPSAHRPRWAFLLAKSQIETGAAPERIAPLLESAAAGMTRDRARALELLAEQHLRRDPPDRLAAARAWERLLMLPQVTDPNEYRYRLAEQLFLLDRLTEARQVATRIPPTAPRGPAAQRLLADCLLRERDYAAAAAVLRELVASAAAHELPRLQYQLGRCCLELRQLDEAERQWRAAAAAHEGSPARFAARVRLGALLVDRDDEAALEMWSSILAEPPPAVWDQPFLMLADVLDAWETTWRSWMQRSRHSEAAQLAESARLWLPPGVALERQGQAWQAAGRAALKLAENGSPDRLADARTRFRAAAAAFEEAASLAAASESQRREWNWLAAENLLRAQNYPRAATLLEMCLAQDPPPRRRSEALIGLAEALQAQGLRARALQVLAEALPHAGPLELRARYLQALIYIELKNYVHAESALRAILTAPATLPEPAEMRQARFALGYVLYWQGRFAEAAVALESAVRWHPDHPEALDAEFWWGDALLQAALQLGRSGGRDAKSDSAREYYEQQRRNWLSSALERFQHFNARIGGQKLTPELEALVRASRFGMGDALLLLEQPGAAAQVFETLVLECGQHLDGAKALRQLALCQLALQRFNDTRATLGRLQRLLADLPEDDFAPPRQSRADWARWLDQTTAALETASR